MTAYRGEIDIRTSSSCVNGIIERFTTNIPQALADVTPEISEKDKENDLNQINEIISDTRNIKKRLDDIGGKCNTPYNGDIIKFKICMKTEYKNLYGEISPGIEEEIYIYCDDIFQYLSGGGGKRRKTKKRNPNL
jgi:hypothetical protein